MNSIETHLVAKLNALAGLVSAIGTRYDWQASAQGVAFPRVVLSVVSRTPTYANAGDSNLDRILVQVSSFATTVSGARTVADLVRQALAPGTVDPEGSSPYLMESEVTDTNDPIDGSDLHIFVVHQTYAILFRTT